ncbi:UxaA family hydrolase [Neptunicella sp. SCSIO 80796]|uniref:UxaA family hydrolase n=1 Tax=Neptunicella plasticusilytica TaxID=3117012 RepID=UPI003A4E5130
MTDVTSHFVHLHPLDNILVCRRYSVRDSQIEIGNEWITLQQDIDVGHKIAILPLDKGSKIIKYGAPIGSASQNIAKGEHVHLSNLQSDYIASHTRTGRNNNVDKESN